MRKQPKSGTAVAELRPVDSVAGAPIPTRDRDSLVAWFELYMGIEVGAPETNTYRAKKGDIQKFVDRPSRRFGHHKGPWPDSR